MTDPLTLWGYEGRGRGWTMPRVPGWWRWWGVRHVRCVWHSWQVDRHEELYGKLGLVPVGYDRWVLFGIWHGLELKQDEPGGGE